MIHQREIVFNATITIIFCYCLGCGCTGVSGKYQNIEENKFGASLQNILKIDSSDPKYVQEDELINVAIALTDQGGEYNIPLKRVTNFNDGREDTEREVLERIDTERIDTERIARMKRRQAKLQELAKRNGWEQHPAIIAAINADSDVFSVIVPIKKGEILGFVKKNQDIIDGVEVYIEPQDE